MKNDLKEKLLKKLKEDKRVLIIIAVGVLGMALIFLSELKPNAKDVQNKPVSETLSYEESIELKLKTLIESIEGAGKAQVMVVFD